MVGPIAGIQQRYDELSPELNERGRRLFAAAEARAHGPGGMGAVSRITGMARSTIGRGVQEIEGNKQVDTRRTHQPGAGRKSKLTEDSTLLTDIERLVASAMRGDPMRPLRWTSKSLRHLSQQLQAEGHSACPHVIANCLHELGYSLQVNRKTREVSGHMDKNAQFEYLNDQADVDPERRAIFIRRSWSMDKEGKPKSQAPKAPVSCIPALAGNLADWRKESPYAADGDWCFHLFAIKVELTEVGVAFPRTTLKLRLFGPE
jgi:hypothetical protein